MAFTRVSIQSASGGSAPAGHLASGFLKEPDLVLCPRVLPDVFENAAPYRAYIFDVAPPPGPPTEPPTPGEVVGLEGISCVCEKVVIVGAICYGFFRLAQVPSELGPIPVGEELSDLSDMTQDELWEDPESELNVAGTQNFDLGEQVILILQDDGDDGFSLCRWLGC